MASKCSFDDNLIAPSRDTVSGGIDRSSNAIRPLVSIVVINTFDVSTTSLLDHISFCNTIFQSGLSSTSGIKLV